MAKRKFTNMDQVPNIASIKDLRAWRKERRSKVKDHSFKVGQADPKEIAYLQSNRTETSITWIGHSTFLLQMSGLNILTDPVWASRMGLDRRLTEPGLRMEDLPPIDVVLISHSHYDHLHLTSLRKLARRNSFKVLVPEGLGSWMKRRGFAEVEELSWWNSTQVGEVAFHFVPAQHWTRRTLTNTNETHWGGWVLVNQKGSIYFAGDSGYFRGFKLIGEKYRIDTALMPIGAYEPEWFMSKQHVSPEEAVQAYLDVGAHRFIPMHYGAFRLADDTAREALDRLQAEWERRQLPKEQLSLLLHGETLRI